MKRAYKKELVYRGVALNLEGVALLKSMGGQATLVFREESTFIKNKDKRSLTLMGKEKVNLVGRGKTSMLERGWNRSGTGLDESYALVEFQLVERFVFS